MSETQDNDARLLAVLDGNVNEVRARLADRSVPDLQRLEELEIANKGRDTVVDAIGKVIIAKADEDGEGDDRAADPATPAGDDDSNDAEPEAGAGDGDTDASDAGGSDARGTVKLPTRQRPAASPKAARGEEVPAWQKAEYSGGLTIEQAEWRNTHLKRK